MSAEDVTTFWMQDESLLCDHGVLGTLPVRDFGLVVMEHFTLVSQTPIARGSEFVLH